MAVVSTGLTLKGLRSEFNARLEQVPVYWPELSTRIPSTTDEEKHRWLGSVPQMREWGTGRLAKGMHAESYDVKNQTYEATLDVDQEELEDDQTGAIKMRVGELATNAATHKDFLIEQLLINGESAGFHSYDGVPFFSDSHASGDSGAQSNKLTYGAVAPDDPTVAEFRKSVAQAIAKMVAFKDDRGLPIRIQPRPEGFICIVPPSMMFTALEALSLALAPTASNPVQGNVIQNAARVITFPGLTDASKWYLGKVDVPVRPFIFQDRLPVEFTALESNSETGFTKGKFQYGVRARYKMAYGYWQYMIRTDFT